MAEKEHRVVRLLLIMIDILMNFPYCCGRLQINNVTRRLNL